MVKDMSYTTISRVLDSWEKARRLPGFEDKVGLLALQKLFELEPRTKEVFGFPRDFKPTDEELRRSGNLLHAISMIHMFDAALSMLGPDTETLREILEDLGKRHVNYHVKAQYYGFMGKAVVYTLSTALASEWTNELEEAWVEVYDELSSEIMKAILINRS